MSVGLGFTRQVGAGTLQTNAASATIGVVTNSGSVSGNLVLLVAYVVGADCTLAKDAGDGWKILDSVYDTGNGFGALIAALRCRTNGSLTGAGITLPGSAAWTAQSYTMNMRIAAAGFDTSPLKYDADSGTPSVGGIAEAASSATVNVPGILPSYSQWVDVAAGGYNNAGTTTTIGSIGNFSELIDTGQASPQHGVWLDVSPVDADPRQSLQFFSATTATLAVAKTNRATVRACIPVTGNVNAGAYRRRFMSSRRMG